MQLSCRHLLYICWAIMPVRSAVPCPDVHMQHTLELLVQGSHAGGGVGQDES